MVTGKVSGVKPPTSHWSPHLLVSVRDAGEAREALAGGADIIDAKDPAAGALGPVSTQALIEIRRAVPARISVSAALGDDPDYRAIRQLTAGIESGMLAFGKVGFAGCRDSREAVAAVRAAADALGAMRLILVAYADWESVSAPSPEFITDLAIRSGVAGLLLDTARKDQGNLLKLWTEDRLKEFVTSGRSAGLLVALGGSITIADLPAILPSTPDIIGIRGAACVGGRSGTVDRRRVTAFRSAMGQPGSLTRIQSPMDSRPRGPTTRKAIPAGSTRLK